MTEEYKMTLTSMHHHEQTMWQLLSIYFVVAGAVIAFWVSSEQPRRPEAILVMLLPALLGVFTFLALLKHRFFWKQDTTQFRELEKIIGFRRSSKGHAAIEKNWRRYFTSFHWALLSIALTVLGLFVAVWISIDPARPIFGIVNQQVFAVLSVGLFFGYGLVMYVYRTCVAS